MKNSIHTALYYTKYAALGLALGIACMALSLLSMGTAAAQDNGCSTSESVYEYLESDTWQETRLLALFSDKGAYVVEIFVNMDTGTWTAVMTFEGTGESCQIDGGKVIDFAYRPPYESTF